MNNKIPSSQIGEVSDSLRFIRVDNLIRFISNSDKRRVQGWFQHDGIEYQLRVTDPDYESAKNMKQGKCYELGRSFLTVSLAGDSFNGAYYRIIAAILPRGGKVAA